MPYCLIHECCREQAGCLIAMFPFVVIIPATVPQLILNGIIARDPGWPTGSIPRAPEGSPQARE